MSNRSTEIYTAVFSYIQHKIFHLQPTQIMTDFEAALRKSIKECYPTAELKGCWFHYERALHNKALELGLHELLKTNPDARFILKELMCLPLLPTEYFREAYESIIKKAIEYEISTRLEPLFKYFDSYWIGQVNTIFFSMYNSICSKGKYLISIMFIECKYPAFGCRNKYAYYIVIRVI